MKYGVFFKGFIGYCINIVRLFEVAVRLIYNFRMFFIIG